MPAGGLRGRAVDVSLGVAALTAPTALDAIPLGTATNPLGLALPVELPVRTIVGTHTVSTSTATPGLIRVHLPMSTSLTAMTAEIAHTPMSLIAMTLMMAGAGAPAPFVSEFPDGFAAGPLSNSSTVAQAGGVIQMVRPFAILGASTGAVLGTVRTTIEFPPEPLAGVSLARGALLLALLGARRRRRASGRAPSAPASARRASVRAGGIRWETISPQPTSIARIRSPGPASRSSRSC